MQWIPPSFRSGHCVLPRVALSWLSSLSLRSPAVNLTAPPCPADQGHQVPAPLLSLSCPAFIAHHSLRYLFTPAMTGVKTITGITWPSCYWRPPPSPPQSLDWLLVCQISWPPPPTGPQLHPTKLEALCLAAWWRADEMWVKSPSWISLFILKNIFQIFRKLFNCANIFQNILKNTFKLIL